MIHDIIEERAFDSPDKKILEIDGESIKYSQFNNEINAIASSNIIPPHAKKIAICIDDVKLKLQCLFACNRLKKTPIILPPNQISISKYKNTIDVDFEINKNNCIIQSKYKNKYIGYQYDANSVQCVLFTSGTFGSSKGVELTFGNMYNSVMNWAKIYSFNEKDIYLNVMPLHHISGLSILFRSIYLNFYSIINIYNTEDIFDMITNNNVTCLSAVPKMIYDFLNIKGYELALSKLKLLLIGGDLINQNHFNYFKKNEINAYVSYGSTETASGIAGYWVADQKQFNPGFLGSPHPNVSISINNGFINIKSNTIMKRYCGDSLANDIFLSTDKAKIISNNVCFIGRDEHQIVSGGENINLQYIQNKFDILGLKLNIVITSCKNLKWGDSVVLLYESDKINQKFVNKIKIYLKDSFPSYMIPKHILNIPHIYRYDNGKINYNDIQAYIRVNIK